MTEEDKHNFEELIAPAATAKELQISVATLRKYSLIIEKVTGKPNYYARTRQKARLYSQKDIQDLKDFHKLSHENGLTLQEAAQQIFAVSAQTSKVQSGADAADKDEKQEVMSAPQMMKLLNALQQTIGQQNSALEKLQKQLNQIEKQNKELLEKQSKIENTKGKDNFASLPDISGIVTDDGDEIVDLPEIDDISADFSVEKPLTAAEKRAQVVNDEKKSRDQVHDEILTKAKENATKNASANVHRTLTDMQLEPEKTHWWQRFLDM